jgi:MFS family permease
VLTLGIFFGLALGLLAGGSLTNLASVRLRWIWALSAAVILRFLTEAALSAGVDFAETFRVPLLAAAFAVLLAGLWVNRSFPGLSIAFVGILSNAVVILVNGGYMPIWEPSLVMAGFSPDEVQSAIHTILPAELNADFLLHLGPFADIIPIPFPIIRNVASVGDVFLTVGLAFFLFAATLRPRGELSVRVAGELTPPHAVLIPSIVESIALDRPLILGGSTPGTAGTVAAIPPFVLEPIPDAGPAVPALPRPAPPIAERVRRHPYVRLALNSSFAALWTGQIVSLFGDRLHQIALAVMVLVTTGSSLAAGVVFMVATVPNVIFGPFAGTLVDRWEHKEVMIVSDLLRAAVVLVIPIAISVHVALVYPLVFVVTTISIFFRPARVAILPRIVEDEDDLMTANSALWVADTSADVIGYPLAAIFVAALGTALPLAFWIDAATYVGSAVLLSAVIVAPRVKPAAKEIGRSFVRELRDGWRFLRNETALFANTLQATAGQITIGVTIALSVVYAERVLDGSLGFDFSAIYGFLETGLGVGNLIGGFVIGLIGARFAKGRMIIVGYVLDGLFVFLLAFATELPAALGLMFGIGVANMIFVIPSQTLFQQRTPNDLLGRVVSFRFALVGAAMTLAMGAGGLFAEIVPVQAVLGAAGLLTVGAGLAGLLVPALRDA